MIVYHGTNMFTAERNEFYLKKGEIDDVYHSYSKLRPKSQSQEVTYIFYYYFIQGITTELTQQSGLEIYRNEILILE